MLLPPLHESVVIVVADNVVVVVPKLSALSLSLSPSRWSRN